MKTTKDSDYYSVVFHYNTFTKIWNCIPRNRFQQYLNGPTYGQGETVEDAFKDYQQLKHYD